MEHPITPPPELVQQWVDKQDFPTFEDIATQAACWGADQQLEECVAWLDGYERDGWATKQMRKDCRPKPPSLAEQALTLLDDASTRLDAVHENTIRRALERLQELEKGNE